MEQLPQRAHVRQVCLPILCCHLCHEIRITRRAEATWRRRPPSVEAEHVRCALGIERIWLTEIAIELIECLQGEGARPAAVLEDHALGEDERGGRQQGGRGGARVVGGRRYPVCPRVARPYDIRRSC